MAESTETDYGQQEAIAVFGQDPRIYETTVKEFIADEKGILKKVKCVKLDWKRDEKTGRMNMTEIPGSEYVLDVDLVFIAAGFLGTEEYIAKDFNLKMTERTNVATKPGEYATSEKVSLLPAICTEASHWSYGRSAKEEKQPKQWIKI